MGRRRAIAVAAAALVAMALAGCTGRGGGQLPPDHVMFKGPASFGFSFSCEDKGGINPPTGQLRIQLSYTDHGTNPLGSSFSIHGTVDTMDEVLESMYCIGQEPPPGGNELIFLGRYRLTSPAPAGFPPECPARETETTPLCRFEVIVRDNDMDRAPSKGDFFKIILSNRTVLESELYPEGSELERGVAPYMRAGVLSGGNLTVD